MNFDVIITKIQLCMIFGYNMNGCISLMNY